MYNKTIIGFGFRMISRIIQTSANVIRLSCFASADNIDLGLNNSWYHAKAESNNFLLLINAKSVEVITSSVNMSL